MQGTQFRAKSFEFVVVELSCHHIDDLFLFNAPLLGVAIKLRYF